MNTVLSTRSVRRCLQAGEEGYMCHVHLTSGVVVMTALRHSDALVSCSSHTVSN